MRRDRSQGAEQRRNDIVDMFIFRKLNLAGRCRTDLDGGADTPRMKMVGIGDGVCRSSLTAPRLKETAQGPAQNAYA